jgi:hypothetical protein
VELVNLEIMNSNKKVKRRDLLTLGIISGAGALTGSGLKRISSNSHKTKKFLTASGELVEVPVKYIPTESVGNRVSNSDLKNWIKEEKGSENAKDKSS